MIFKSFLSSKGVTALTGVWLGSNPNSSWDPGYTAYLESTGEGIVIDGAFIGELTGQGETTGETYSAYTWEKFFAKTSGIQLEGPEGGDCIFTSAVDVSSASTVVFKYTAYGSKAGDGNLYIWNLRSKW